MINRGDVLENMLVASEKFEVTEIIENACPEYDGAGNKLIVPYGIEPAFTMPCSNCFGEKVVSEDLQKRKDLAAVLREMLHECDLTMHEAAQRFSQKMLDWNDARTGRAPLEVIQAKIDLLKTI
jgi:hypothetical protein